jgi:hypothetical protein
MVRDQEVEGSIILPAGLVFVSEKIYSVSKPFSNAAPLSDFRVSSDRRNSGQLRDN